jgi:hypothetical protein
MLLTPALAKQWLDGKRIGEAVDPVRVDAYAKAMLAGLGTAQGIP